MVVPTLAFTCLAEPKNKANGVRITLDATDTYTVKFTKFSMKSLDITVIDEISGVYAEDLRRVFTSATGLDCTLGRVA